jgi:hypothetical protein
MNIGTSEVYLAQEDGGLPLTLAAGSAPGESGVYVLRVKFRDGMHFNATPRQHLVWFQLSNVRIECRRAGRKLTQDVSAGGLAICPAGIDCAADADEGGDALAVAIDPGRLALAAAEDSALDAQLLERARVQAGKTLDGKNPWRCCSTHIDSAEEIQDLVASLGEFFPRLAIIPVPTSVADHKTGVNSSTDHGGEKGASASQSCGG